MPTALGTIASQRTVTAPTLPIPSAGLAGWWDADDAATFSYSSGTVVSEWRDKSGSNRHVSQATVAKQPNRNGIQNGRTTVTFAGANYFLKSASFTLPQPFTLVIAYTHTSGVIVFSEGNTWLCLYGSGYMGMKGTTNLATGSDFSSSGAHAYVAEWTSPIPNMYRDNGPADPYIDNADIGPVGITTGIAFSENGGGYGTAFVGTIFEVCLYGRVLTAPERGAMFDYLKTKWGTP